MSRTICSSLTRERSTLLSSVSNSAIFSSFSSFSNPLLIASDSLTPFLSSSSFRSFGTLAETVTRFLLILHVVLQKVMNKVYQMLPPSLHVWNPDNPDRQLRGKCGSD